MCSSWSLQGRGEWGPVQRCPPVRAPCHQVLLLGLVKLSICARGFQILYIYPLTPFERSTWWAHNFKAMNGFCLRLVRSRMQCLDDSPSWLVNMSFSKTWVPILIGLYSRMQYSTAPDYRWKSRQYAGDGPDWTITDCKVRVRGKIF